jgi:hypothetical protein
VLIGCVARNEVEHDPKPAGVACGQQAVEIIERAEQRVDARVIGDVVAEVSHW